MGKVVERFVWWCLGLVLQMGIVAGIAVGGIWLLASILLPEETPEERQAEEFKKAEDRRKGFHCLSPWDGSHREFELLVKRHMNDPDSFEHVSTRVTPVQSDTGRHTIIMEFRGRNAFGGVVTNTAIGSYSSYCSPVLDDIQ